MDEYMCEQFEHAGMTVKIFQDPEPRSPSDWDQLGTLVAFSPMAREWGIGDRKANSQEEDAFGIESNCGPRGLKHEGWEMLARYLRLTEGAEAVPFTFRDYGSGGARLNESDGDRASGFIYCDQQEIISEYGDDSPTSRDRAREVLSGELESWSMYVERKVYGFTVETLDGEEKDSLWGIYDDEYWSQDGKGKSAVEMEAKSAAECAATEYHNLRKAWQLEHAAAAYGFGWGR